MVINNLLLGESFRYSAKKCNMEVRRNEIGELQELVSYCKEIEEGIVFDEEIWNIEVEENIALSDWLFSGNGAGAEDDRRIVLEILFKSQSIIEDGNSIDISLGEFPNAAYTLFSYLLFRRKLLALSRNSDEFALVMPSCFPDTEFAENIEVEMRKIEDFQMNAPEIVQNLSVLNDEALEIFESHHGNSKEAMDILSSKLLECSPDPKHRAKLLFTFSYDENDSGDSSKKYKEILCEPHLKLIRKDSNLRIYFQWKDEQVGDNKKVLVGRIGGHPYKK